MARYMVYNQGGISFVIITGNNNAVTSVSISAPGQTVQRITLSGAATTERSALSNQLTPILTTYIFANGQVTAENRTAFQAAYIRTLNRIFSARPVVVITTASSGPVRSMDIVQRPTQLPTRAPVRPVTQPVTTAVPVRIQPLTNLRELNTTLTELTRATSVATTHRLYGRLFNSRTQIERILSSNPTSLTIFIFDSLRNNLTLSSSALSEYLEANNNSIAFNQRNLSYLSSSTAPQAFYQNTIIPITMQVVRSYIVSIYDSNSNFRSQVDLIPDFRNYIQRIRSSQAGPIDFNTFFTAVLLIGRNNLISRGTQESSIPVWQIPGVPSPQTAPAQTIQAPTPQPARPATVSSGPDAGVPRDVLARPSDTSDARQAESSHSAVTYITRNALFAVMQSGSPQNLRDYVSNPPARLDLEAALERYFDFLQALPATSSSPLKREFDQFLRRRGESINTTAEKIAALQDFILSFNRPLPLNSHEFLNKALVGQDLDSLYASSLLQSSTPRVSVTREGNMQTLAALAVLSWRSANTDANVVRPWSQNQQIAAPPQTTGSQRPPQTILPW